jgi:hypothetical protein
MAVGNGETEAKEVEGVKQAKEANEVKHLS